MRRLIFQAWVSIDGYAADKNGSTKFFENNTAYNKDWDKDELAFLNTVDTLILGANTYKMFAVFWPGADLSEEIIAETFNSLHKIVFSKTLKSAPWGKWESAEVVSTDAVVRIKELKNEQGKDLLICGSLSLAKSLIAANLVDEYQLCVAPSFVGDGKTYLPRGIEESKMKLIECKPYATGVIFLKYRPNDIKLQKNHK